MQEQIKAGLERSFRKHRIVFWHDPQERFRDDFDAIEITGVTKAELNSNEFMLKHRLIREEPRQPFLVYRPGPSPADAENWLLDLEMAHGVFLADRGALLLNELGLPHWLKDIVERHGRFFDARPRVEKLKSMLDEHDDENSLRLKMLAVCAGASPQLQKILEALLAELARHENKAITQIERFDLLDTLWAQLHTVYGYTDETPSIDGLARALFWSSYRMELDETTQMNQEALVFMGQWSHDTRHRETFRMLSDHYAADLAVDEDLPDRPLDRLTRMKQFEGIDRQVLRALKSAVLDRELPHERIETAIRERRTSIWWETYSDLYEAILYASKLQHRVAQLALPAMTLKSGFESYAADWFEIDQVYRKFVLHAGRTLHRDVVSDLSERVENLYTNDYLMPINDAWQRAIDTAARWDEDRTIVQRRFFNRYVAPLRDKNAKAVVIISDAMRYEIGEELFRRVRAINRFEAHIDPVLGSIPSNTQLGMAALLPHRKLELGADATASIDGASATGTANRAKILASERATGKSRALKAEEITRMNADELRELTREHDVIYIYHNIIDATGDKTANEGRVFEAAEDAIADIERMIRRLSGNNVSNMLVTADHGFIYQDHPIHEGDFSPAQLPEGITHKDRRFVLGEGVSETDGLTHFTAATAGIDTAPDILIPRSIGRLRLSGSGSRYVHGGAALQEIVLPVLSIRKSRTDDVEPVVVRPLENGRKLITTGQHLAKLYQETPISEKCHAIRLRVGLYAKDGTLLSNEVEKEFAETSTDLGRRETSIKLILSKASNAYDNQQIELVLTRIDGGRERIYNRQTLQLKRSYGGEFDI